MNNKIRFGVIGTGGIAGKFAEAMNYTDNAEITACASRTPGKAVAYAKRYGIAVSYDNYEDLLSNPNVDAVYIATTPNFHYENLISCIKAGKHILCEKPFLSTSKKTREIIKIAEGTGLFMMEAMWSRFLPPIIKARDIIRSGELGRLLHIESHFSIKVSPSGFPRGYNRLLEGSTMTDMGIYNLDITSFLAGSNPDDIKTTPGVILNGTETEANVLLHYPGDITAYMLCGFRFPTGHDLVAYCEDGRIELKPYFVNPACVEVIKYNGESTVYDYDIPNGFEFEIEEAVRCIREGRQQSEVHPWRDTLVSADVFDKLFSAWGNPFNE